MEAVVLDGFQPDLTIILDLPVDVGLARAASRSEKDRFEKEDTAFFEKVRAAFHHRVQTAPSRYRVLDTSPDLSIVQRNLDNVLNEYLASN